jgi:hypothetical protein
MNIFVINAKGVLEVYVGRSPTPSQPDADHVDICTTHNFELSPHAQRPHSTSRSSNSAVAHVTVDGKAKHRNICGSCPCCEREDITLSRIYNRPMMVLAVGLVDSFRTVFDSFRWNLNQICQICRMCYVVSSKPWRKLVPNSVTFDN